MFILYQPSEDRDWERLSTGRDFVSDRVQDKHEEQEFWMTRLDWVGIRLNEFEMFEEHENCLSRWKNFVLVENSVEWKPCINR